MSMRWKKAAFRTAILASSATISVGASAQQADWTFGYAGVHGGYDWSDLEVEGLPGSVDLDGFAGGLLVGYNFYQSGNFVAGIEADITWLNGDGKISESETWDLTCSAGTLVATESASVSADLNWKATLRGRAGLLVDPTVFVYGTAGVAWANADVAAAASTVATFDPFDCVATFESEAAAEDVTFFGGVVGGGVETQLASNFYARAELLHFFFGDESIRFDGTQVDLDLDETIARAAVVFRFN